MWVKTKDIDLYVQTTHTARSYKEFESPRGKFGFELMCMSTARFV